MIIILFIIIHHQSYKHYRLNHCQIGTEETPFQHEAIIEMHGNQQSTELPMYGAKTLAVRNGTSAYHCHVLTISWYVASSFVTV